MKFSIFAKSQKPPLCLKALEVAQTQIGVREIPKGSNWGPEVSVYLQSVGIKFPASWCMAFVYWCHDKAASGLRIKNPMYKTGGVLLEWNKSKSKFSNTPQPGAVFIMDYGRGLGHTGIVESFTKDEIFTIEGNTNDTGSREGYEVCRRTRPRKNVLGYLVFK